MRFILLGNGHGLGKKHDKHDKDAAFFDASTDGMMEAVAKTIRHPPETWAPYLEKRDYKGIYDMESAELGRAIKASMDGKTSIKDVAREIRHTFAAMLLCQAHSVTTPSDNDATAA